MSRRTVRTAATAMVVGVAAAVLAAPGQASAHSSLTSSSPKDGGTVTSPKKTVTLRFNEDIQSKFATIAVTGPDGKRVSTGKPAVDGTVVKQSLTGFRVTGKYLVGWRVVSADGHPVSGKFSFTVAKGAVQASATPAPSTATTSASPQPAGKTSGVGKQQAADDRSFVERHAAHLLIGAVILLAGVAVVLWERRRRHD